MHHGGLVKLCLYLPKAVTVQQFYEVTELVVNEILWYDLGRELVLLVLLLTWMDVGRMDEKKRGSCVSIA